MIIGSHVSFGPNQLLSSTKEAISYGANTFMFYTGAPQNTIRKELNANYLIEAQNLMKENNIDIKNVICHAPYIVNLATKNDQTKRDFSINFLKNEIKRCEMLGVTKIVVHPGNAVGITKEEGLNNIIEALNIIIPTSNLVTVLIETMAGKGTECASDLDELKTILNGVKSNNIGVCLDTCHLNDSGYNMKDFDGFIKIFEEKIALEKIMCVHINDSKNEQGAKKDRHENFGFGTIGFDSLINIIYNDKLKDVPKILETPYIGNQDGDKERLYPPYKFEIEMIKSKKFNQSILDDIRNYYRK